MFNINKLIQKSFSLILSLSTILIIPDFYKETKAADLPSNLNENQIVDITTKSLKRNQTLTTLDTPEFINYSPTVIDTKLVLNWNNLTDSQGVAINCDYLIALSSTENFKYSYTHTIETSLADLSENHVRAFTLTELHDGSNVYAKIKARKGDIESAWGSVIHVTIKHLKIEEPVLLCPEIVNQNFVTIYWGKITGDPPVEKYVLQYCYYGCWDDAQSEDISNPSNTLKDEQLSYTITNLNDETRYYIRMKAISGKWESDWSRNKEVEVVINELPYFDYDAFLPKHNEFNILKLPILEWAAIDPDGDSLDFQVKFGKVYGTGTWTLRYFNSSTYKGKSSYDFAEEYTNLPLEPKTTYYWQIEVKETDRDLDYYKKYGDGFIKSQQYLFKTEESGPDPYIKNIELLDEVKPRSKVRFKVSVGNSGEESTLNQQCIKAVYIKNGEESPFFNSDLLCTKTNIAPGSTDDVTIAVHFLDDIHDNGNTAYDNVLIPGISVIRFYLDTVDTYDKNLKNNSYEKEIIYTDNSKPVITDLFLREYGQYQGTSFWARMGKKLTIEIEAIDDIEISQLIIEYRLNQMMDWYIIHSIPLDTYNLSHYSYKWSIPTDISTTEQAQIRIRLTDTSGNESTQESNPFKIVSNKLNATIAVKNTSCQINDDIHYSFTIDAVYPINYIIVKLFYSDQSKNIQSDHHPDGLDFLDEYQWTIHDDNYVSQHCYLQLTLTDIYQNNITVKSNEFNIQPDFTMPYPFHKKIELYNFELPFPEDAIEKQQKISAEFVRLDENNIVHAIVSHLFEYYQNTGKINEEDKHIYIKNFHYITYDPSTELISSPMNIFEGITEQYQLLDFVLMNNTPFILLKKANEKEKYFWMYRTEVGFSLPQIIENEHVADTLSFKEWDSSEQLLQVDSRRYIYSNGRIWRLSFSENVQIFKFFSGNIDNETYASSDNSEYLNNSNIKPVIDDKDYTVYFIDSEKSKLVRMNTSDAYKNQVNILTFDMPFTIENNSYQTKTAIYSRTYTSTFIFGNGHVYKLENERVIDYCDIQYTFGGQNVQYADHWDKVNNIFVVKTEEKVYVILQLNDETFPKPEDTGFEILEFNPEQKTFTKNVVCTSRSQLNIDDFVYIDNDQVLLINNENISSLIHDYKTNLYRLNLKTGALDFIDSLELEHVKSTMFIRQQNSLFILGNCATNPNRTNSYYLGNTSKEIFNQEINQVENMQFIVRDDKLYALWEKGFPFDGTWNHSKNELNDTLNLRNIIKQIYPAVEEKKSLSDTFLGNGKANMGNDYLSFSFGKTAYLFDDEWSLLSTYNMPNMGEDTIRFKPFDSKFFAASYFKHNNLGQIQLCNINKSDCKAFIANTYNNLVSTYENEAIISGILRNKHTPVVFKINLLTGQTFFKSQQDGIIVNSDYSYDINQNQYLALAWERYLTVGNFSKVKDLNSMEKVIYLLKKICSE